MIVAALAGVLAGLLAHTGTNSWRSSGRRSLHQHRGRRPDRPRSTPAASDPAAFLDAVARRVRTGSSLTAAILDELERCPALDVVAERLQQGGGLAEALISIEAVEPDLVLTLQALSATARMGGPVAATLDEAASVLRERGAARAERRAHSAQARLSARVMTIVPLAFAAWNAVGSDSSRHFYLGSVVGGGCATAGLMLNLAGWWWMNRIIGPR